MENHGVNLSLPLYTVKHYKKTFKQTKNPILKNMIKVWSDVKKFLKEPQSLSQFSPLWGNQSFPPGQADATFQLRKAKGLGMV